MKQWILYTSCLLVLTAACLAEDIPVSNERFRIEPGESLELSAQLPQAIEDNQGKLTLEVWIGAKSFAGFSGAFRVFWNGVELKRAEERPTTFRLQNGYVLQSYSDHSGWIAAYANEPEQVRHVNSDSGYNFVEAEFDVIRYVLPVPAAASGPANIEVKALTKEAPLVVQDIRIRID